MNYLGKKSHFILLESVMGKRRYVFFPLSVGRKTAEEEELLVYLNGSQ